MRIFALRVTEMRNELKLTIPEMARKSGIPEKTIYHWERGERIPKIDSLKKLCDYFNCSADFLIGRTDEERW